MKFWPLHKRWISCSAALCMILLTACRDDDALQDVQSDQKVRDTLQLVLPKTAKPALRLVAPAKRTTVQWPIYKMAAGVVDSLKQTDVFSLQRSLDQLAIKFIALKKTEVDAVRMFPDTLDTPSVNARLMVVETQARILKNLTESNNPDSLKITQQMVALHNALQDLNLQINERFGTNIEDLLKEFNLDKEDKKATPKRSTIQGPRGKPPITRAPSFMPRKKT